MMVNMNNTIGKIKLEKDAAEREYLQAISATCSRQWINHNQDDSHETKTDDGDEGQEEFTVNGGAREDWIQGERTAKNEAAAGKSSKGKGVKLSLQIPSVM
jgi:hypothetical protein